ncbi:MAG: PD-(D/E)XK nuclease family protein [Oscillospiraceae bacterium]|nr:PD-(D/E)XK nuclease family protein [Oscillospiraceae bacterium]
MLQLMLGSAGSGKTTAIHQAVRRWVTEGRAGECILLVPEQSSFETERQMLRLLGAKDSQKVTVVSFRRLTDWVFRQYGRPQGTILSDGGRSVLMSLALEQVSPELAFYQRYANTDELIELLLSFAKELKLCGISLEQFLEKKRLASEETLRTKMEDIGLILSAYEALVAQSYVDPLDDLTRIRPMVAEQKLFSGSGVFIDGFKDFTMQELQLLREMLGQCQQMTVALCTDHLHDPEGGTGLFAPVCKTASALTRMAREQGVPVAKPILLQAGVRYRSEALAFLAQQLFRGKPEQFTGDTADVLCFCGKNRADEVAFVAQEIRCLVMEQGYRYGDFAVIARDLAPYRGVLDVAFDRHQISYFLDDPRTVDSEPIVQVVLSAFRIIHGGYDTEDVLSYLKTGMVSGFSDDEIARLENYTYLWRITGKQWKSPWSAHPGGFAGALSEDDAEELCQLNGLRERLLSALERFASALRSQTGREISASVYAFLLDIGADQQVLALGEKLRALGQFSAAEEQVRMWELLMQVLDQMALLLHDTVLSGERYASLFQLVLSQAEMATIPEGIDQVSIGEAGRMRPADPKVVFLLGAVQEEFPASVSDNGAFCDRERQEMIHMGLPLVSTLDDRELDEQYLAYTAALSGSEKLYVCWYQMNLTGERKTPSSLVKGICSILPQIKCLTRTLLPREREAVSPDTAFGLLSREYRSLSLLSVTLEALLQQDPTQSPRLSALARTVNGSPRSFAQLEKARQLFPEKLRLSASQIESFYLCQFQYFCKYGLRVKERKPAEVTALEYGRLMHFLLEHLFRNLGHEALCAMTDSQLHDTIEEAIRQYLQEEMGGIDDKSPRFLYQFHRLTDASAVVIRHVAHELSQSEFQPIGYEMTVGPGGDFPPLTVSAGDGTEAAVIGVIDRVDLYVENGEAYVRIIDYKTGKKEFRLFDVLNGINLQMLLYLAALLEGKHYRPAGILYMPAARPVVSADKDTPPEKIQSAVEKKLRMNGLLVEDPMLVTAMERDGAGKYIPATVKDGEVKRSASTVSNVQMDQVLSYIRHLVGEMAHQLHSGQVQDAPLKGSYDSCAYCPYFPICCHEEADGGRVRLKLDKGAVLEQIANVMEEEEMPYGKLDTGAAGRH